MVRLIYFEPEPIDVDPEPIELDTKKSNQNRLMWIPNPLKKKSNQNQLAVWHVDPEPVEEEIEPEPINTDGKPVIITDATFKTEVLAAKLPVVQ